MGNSSGNLDAWAAAFEAHPAAQGGFIWDWIENQLVEMAQPRSTAPARPSRPAAAFLRPQDTTPSRPRAQPMSSMSLK